MSSAVAEIDPKELSVSSLLVILLLGSLYARLVRADSAIATAALPEDVWAAFDAATRQEAVRAQVRASTAHAVMATPTIATGPFAPGTVGSMAQGEEGYVSARAAMIDPVGGMWLAAAAVVHAAPKPGLVRLRRADDGYHLQRHDGVVALWDGERSGSVANACVPVADLFD